MPSWVVSTPRRRARSRPSLAASMPTRRAGCSTSEVRKSFTNKSVPMLPEPITAAFFFDVIRAG